MDTTKCHFSIKKMKCLSSPINVSCIYVQCKSRGLVFNFGLHWWLLLFYWLLRREMWLKGKKAVMKFKNSMDNSQGVNRYQLPNINNYMMPIPPAPPPPSGRIIRENRLESWRRRRFRPTTAPDGLDPLFTRVNMESSFLLLI